MAVHASLGVPRSDADTPITLVLLCQNLERSTSRLELASLGSWLSSHRKGVKVGLVEDLCHQPSVIRSAVRRVGAQRLVLGLCSKSYAEVELPTHARRAGLDPLGIQMVDLGNSPGRDAFPAAVNARARVLLAAAVARARAFTGSQPENLKTVLLSSGQRISRRALFALPPVSYATVPTISQTMCAAKDGCDQCVRACPHTALEKDGDAILVNRSQCESCGTCVAVCPQRAVEFPGWSPEELEAQVASLLDAQTDLEVKAVAFSCKNAPISAGNGWLPVRVPCASMVSIQAILETLARGASAVALQRCGEQCTTGLAETLGKRVDYCQQLLQRLGGPSESKRVCLLSTEQTTHPGSVPALSPPPGEISRGALTLFGRGVAARAVMGLAARHGVKTLVLEHLYSPLGIVEIDPQACTACSTCASACPTGAITSERRDDEVVMVFDASICTACGLCESSCPEKAEGAIRVSRVTDTDRLSLGPQVLSQDQESRCERCGAPVATRRMLQRIAALLGKDYNPQFMERRCISCRVEGTGTSTSSSVP